MRNATNKSTTVAERTADRGDMSIHTAPTNLGTGPILRRILGKTQSGKPASEGPRRVRDGLDAVLADLADLRMRMDAIAGDVADLVLEVRAWRADQARRRAASEQGDRDALLGVLIADIVADEAFLASDILVRAVEHLELRQALAFAGASNGRKLGHLLVRLGGRGSDNGCHFVRTGSDRGAALWRVLRD